MDFVVGCASVGWVVWEAPTDFSGPVVMGVSMACVVVYISSQTY